MELHKVERMARLCDSCQKMCRHVCTTHLITCSEADTPNERCSIAYRALLRGEFLPAEAPYMFEKCAICGLCLTWCESDIDAGEVMLAARADLVNAGLAPASALTVNENVMQFGNPFGEPINTRFTAVSERIRNLPEHADVLYFAGCNALYRQPEIVDNVITILSNAKVNFTVLKQDDLCCGKPLRLLGFLENFRKNAIQVINNIRQSKALRVVCTCPGCLRYLREIYPLMGIEIPPGVQFLHFSEFLVDLINSGNVHFNKGIEKRVSFHDSCDLGRRLEIYEAPRQVIRALPGIEFVELQFNRQDARCCGSGGGLGFTNPGLVFQAGKKVVGLAQEVKSELLITACATCKKTFLPHTNTIEHLDSLDIAELAVMAM